MLIVVENNTAQAHGIKVDRSAIFKPMGRIFNADFGQLHLKLPGWAQDVIKKSKDLTDDLVGVVHKGHVKMVHEVLGEIQNITGSSSASCFSDMMNAMDQDIKLGPQPGSIFLDRYGENFYVDCMREMATPYYDKVVVLTDETATFDKFKTALNELNSQGYLIDIVLDVHGCGIPNGADSTMNNGGCSKIGLGFSDGFADPKDLMTNSGTNGNPKPMNLNAVYMVSCWGGSNFNKTWIKLGAKASNGSNELNYYTLLSPLVFMDAWTSEHMSLKAAAEKAYKAEKLLMNGKSHKIKFKLRNPTGQKETIKIRIGASWEKLMNKELAKQYGYDKNKPVNNIDSSKRQTAGDPNVRRAGL